MERLGHQSPEVTDDGGNVGMVRYRESDVENVLEIEIVEVMLRGEWSSLTTLVMIDCFPRRSRGRTDVYRDCSLLLEQEIVFGVMEEDCVPSLEC
jgi:hypothetical protein